MKDAHKEHKDHAGGPRHHDGQKAHHGGPRGKHGLEGFRDDKWEPTAGGPHGDTKDRAAEGTTRMLGLAEKILPILTAEQRKIAADKIRAMSAKGETPFAH